MRSNFVIAVLVLLASSMAVPAPAQQSIDTLLQRGYVEEWLVCGPFNGGEPGVVERVSSRLLPVPDEDFLQSVGGVRQVRPEEGLVVKTDSGDRVWQRLRTSGERIDFTTLIGDAPEANVYAACIVRTEEAADLLIDFQTMLGARLWLNGFPVATVSPTSPTAAGLQRHVIRLRRGDNLILMQVPLAALDAVAAGEGLSAEVLRDAILATRPLLANATGYEAAIRFRPAARAGQLIVVPRLVDTGRFTGQGSTLAQELAFELFNPGPGNAEPATVRVRFGPSDPWIEKAIRALPPQTQSELLFGMPVSGFQAGEIRQAEIQIETTEAKGGFMARVAVRSSPSRGTAYVLTGMTGPMNTGAQSEDAARRMTAMSRHVTLLEYEPNYGFYLGGVESWRPFYVMNPDARTALRDAVTRGRVAANGGFAVPDERLVSGELIARNLLHGHQSALDSLGLAGHVYLDWQTRGIAPQTAQVLNQAGFAGRVFGGKWLPERHGPLWFRGLDGSRIALWSMNLIAEPRTATELQTRVVEAREAFLGSGIDSGIYVAEVSGESSPVYVLNEAAALREAVPSIRFEASGAERVFESLREFGDRNPAAYPDVTRIPVASALGDLIVQRPLKDAYAAAEDKADVAERFAALASMHGAPYPNETFDWMWRQLLFYSEPNVLGRAASPRLFLDAVNGFHHVAAMAETETQRALTSLAGSINTATEAPRSTNANNALVVFNPSFHTRTDVCTWRIPPNVGSGFSILAESGNPVAHALRTDAVGSTAQFVVNDIAPLGYRTYYLVPGGTPSSARPGEANTIENAFFRIVVDPARGGVIANLEDKATGTGLLDGLGNEVLVLQEDSGQYLGGRELWVDAIADRASASAAQVQTVRSDVFEQARIVCPLAGGELIRTITLFHDTPRIDFETTFRGINAQDRALAIQFGMVPQGHALITGERYAATVNAAGADPSTPRTNSTRFHTASYPRAALRWAAVSANDHIRAGANVAIPIRPAVIVHNDEAFLNEARALARALAGRGVPSVLNTASEEKRRLDAVGQGHTFVILLGGAADNPVTRQLIERLDQSARESADGMIAAGQPFAIGNARLNDAAPMVDVLILGGDTAAATELLISEVVDAVGNRGTLEIPPRAYTGPSPRPLPTRGLAMVYEGTNLVTHGTDGALTLFAAHDGNWESDADALAVEAAPLDYSIRYSLIPFEGDWRKAAIPLQAQANVNPLRAVQTGLHLGKLPSEHSFGSLNNDAFVVTAFKAAHSTPGYVLRGYEAHGMPVGNTAFNLSSNMTRGWHSNAIEQNRNPFSMASQGFPIALEPFSVATYAFETPTPGGGTRSSTNSEPSPPQFTRYWRHHVGAAPDANPAATLLLQGDLDRSDTLTLRVLNEQREALSGEVQLTPSTGWTVAPQSIPVTLGPNESLERRILVVRPEGAPGGVIATLQTGGSAYRDIVTTEPEAFNLVVEPSERELVVRVQNRIALPLSGRVEVILPPDAWPESGGAETVAPWTIAFDVGPLEEHRAAFVWQGAGPARWYAVKAYGNGHVTYQTVP